MDCHRPRRRTLLHLAASLLAPATAHALEGLAAIETKRFGIVGTMSDGNDYRIGGFPATQIAPSWAITAGHVAPAVGKRYVDDYGQAKIVGVTRLTTTAPTEPPFGGALRDDLALLRLAEPIAAPYLPRLIDDARLQQRHADIEFTLVSNNPGLHARRTGHGSLRVLTRRRGYDYLIVGSRDLQLVPGDSGSALFLGHLADSDAWSILAGVASARTTDTAGQHLAVYARIGAHRSALDALVGESGQRLNWVG